MHLFPESYSLDALLTLECHARRMRAKRTQPAADLVPRAAPAPWVRAAPVNGAHARRNHGALRAHVDRFRRRARLLRALYGSLSRPLAALVRLPSNLHPLR